MILYLFVRLFLFPFAFLPHRLIHLIGAALSPLPYILLPSWRKRALSNLSLQGSLPLTLKQKRTITRQAFANLLITVFEYSKFAYSKSIDKTIICVNPETADKIRSEGKGIVFFCGHQSNWEALFLDGTRRMPGVAIGRPIKNLHLYNWIQSIRERFGGTIVDPAGGIAKGFRALKGGKFMGIVGDQGMPEEGYFSSFLGTPCWTSPVPAMLSYRANVPLMVATTHREKGKYFITYSDPIYPDLSRPLEQEIPRLMDYALDLFGQSVIKHPGEWLWQHNRWKQETPKRVYYRYRHDSILAILPPAPAIDTLREIYPHAFLTFLLPSNTPFHPNEETISYSTPQERYLDDYRFKMVLNFSGDKKLSRYYKKRALKVLDLSPTTNLTELLCRCQPTAST